MKLSKSQALSEYAICLAVILAVIFGMQTYVRRGLAGRYKRVVNHATSVSGILGTGRQVKPYYTEERFVVKQSNKVSDKMKLGGGRKKNYITDTIKVKGDSLQKVTYSPMDDLRLPDFFKPY